MHRIAGLGLRPSAPLIGTEVMNEVEHPLRHRPFLA